MAISAALAKQHSIVSRNGVASAMPFLRFAGHSEKTWEYSNMVIENVNAVPYTPLS